MLRQKLAAFETSRAKSEPLPRGVAPYTSSNMFRSRRGRRFDGDGDGNGFKNPQLVKRWDHRLSLESRNRFGSTLKASASAAKTTVGLDHSLTGLISLGTARPVSDFFPWQSIVICGGGGNYSHHRHGDVGAGAINVPEPEPKLEPEPMPCAKGEDDFDLSVALNYGYSAGSPQVLRFVTEHVELIHDPLYDDWESCLTCGTTSAIEIVLRMFCNRGDWILTEAYTYPGAIEAAKPLGVNIMGVEMDDKGLLPNDLHLKLCNWDADAKGPKPFVLYMIPSGHNPTGTTQTAERRRAIYQVAERHDLLILEDDPYYLLQLYDSTCTPVIDNKVPLGADEYLKRLPASYVSLDVSGRVIRFDSTSKILAPGLRCGWLTACSQIVEKFLAHTEFSMVAPSGPSQVMLYKLLDVTWGHDGFINWLAYLSQQYRHRRDTLIRACRRHLPSNVCHWTAPEIGMFLWIRLDPYKISAARLDHRLEELQPWRLDVEDQIYLRAKENGVLVSKGSWFSTQNDQSSNVYFRLTFAATAESALDQAVERFANAFRAV